MKKKLLCLSFVLMLALLFAGCGSRTVGEMYRLPKRSAEYKTLQVTIEHAMGGMEYASPVSGENQQTVQMADLTGDGVDEFLVFAKGNSERPLQILIFTQIEEEKYQLFDKVELNGVAFEQVEYVDIDDRPGCEMVVGRRLNNQVMRIASVYSFGSGAGEQIMSTIYAKFLTCDLDANGRHELMVIRQGEAETASAVAVLYDFQNGMLERSKEAELSDRVECIRRMEVSKLESGEPAVYIASALDENTIVTDIFAVVDKNFCNLSFSSEYGNSVQTLRNYYVYSEDIDDDGVLELPRLIPMQPTSFDKTEEKQYLICWYAMDRSGKEYDKMYSFHNFTGGWYMRLNPDWAKRIAAEREGSTYTFYMWNEEFAEAVPVFALFSLTGKDRDSQADIQNRFALHRGESVVYAAKLEPASAMYGITEDYLTSGFHLIHMDWKTGET